MSSSGSDTRTPPVGVRSKYFGLVPPAAQLFPTAGYKRQLSVIYQLDVLDSVHTTASTLKPCPAMEARRAAAPVPFFATEQSRALPTDAFLDLWATRFGYRRGPPCIEPSLHEGFDIADYDLEENDINLVSSRRPRGISNQPSLPQGFDIADYDLEEDVGDVLRRHQSLSLYGSNLSSSRQPRSVSNQPSLPENFDIAGYDLEEDDSNLLSSRRLRDVTNEPSLHEGFNFASYDLEEDDINLVSSRRPRSVSNQLSLPEGFDIADYDLEEDDGDVLRRHQSLSLYDSNLSSSGRPRAVSTPRVEPPTRPVATANLFRNVTLRKKKPMGASIAGQSEEPEVHGQPRVSREDDACDVTSSLADEATEEATRKKVFAVQADEVTPPETGRRRGRPSGSTTSGSSTSGSSPPTDVQVHRPTRKKPRDVICGKSPEATRQQRVRRRGRRVSASTTPDTTPEGLQGPKRKLRRSVGVEASNRRRRRRRRRQEVPCYFRMPRVRTQWPLVRGRDPFDVEIIAEIKTPKRQYDPDKPSRYRRLWKIRPGPPPADSSEVAFDALVHQRGRPPASSAGEGRRQREDAVDLASGSGEEDAVELACGSGKDDAVDSTGSSGKEDGVDSTGSSAKEDAVDSRQAGRAKARQERVERVEPNAPLDEAANERREPTATSGRRARRGRRQRKTRI